MAVRSSTSAVASLTSPSPSRIDTSRGGSPSRFAIEVAATTSVGLMTAPSAIAAPRFEVVEQHEQHEPGDERAHHDEQHRERRDAREVAAEVDHRHVERRRVEQRRQHAHEDDLGLDVDLGDPGDEAVADAEHDEEQRGGDAEPPREGGGGDHDDDAENGDEGVVHAPELTAASERVSTSP